MSHRTVVEKERRRTRESVRYIRWGAWEGRPEGSGRAVWGIAGWGWGHEGLTFRTRERSVEKETASALES